MAGSSGRWRGRHVACCAALLLATASAEFVKGFTQAKPVVPSKDPTLVVEQVWQFEYPPNMLDQPVHMAFVPGTTKVITGHKTGTMRLYASIDAAVDDFIELANVSADVDSEGDHGLNSFALHPDFGLPGGPQQIFLLYSGNPKDVNLLPNNKVVSPLRPATWGKGPPAPTGFSWGDGECPDLKANNDNGLICEKVYYLDRYAIDVDAGTMTKEITLLTSVCGSSSTHGPGTLLTIGKDLVFSAGDGSQFVVFDPGYPTNNACYEPGAGDDQGVFTSQRLDFPNGKVTVIPYALLGSKVALTYDQLRFISKGNRQPFRMHYHEAADTLYIADVGFGDGGTTERIFTAQGVSKMTDTSPIFNWGWPCIEGLFSSVPGFINNDFNPLDTVSEQERQTYLVGKKLPTCDPVYSAVKSITSGAPVAGADPMFRAPSFEYRVGTLDPDFPGLCTYSNAAVTGVMVYDGEAMPDAFTNKLIFSDYAKQCIFYFDPLPDGTPNFKSYPHILLAGMGFVDMQIGPDGALYGIDYTNIRIVRMYKEGTGPGAGQVTDTPTTPPTPAPFAEPTDVPAAQMCFDPKAMPEFQWQREDDGTYTGQLTLAAGTITTKQGTMRTRVYNGLMPGPLMRMEACGTYKLTVVNDQAEWPAGLGGANNFNTEHDPTVTNLHLHGLHISGLAPGDDPLTVIAPGDSYTYTYVIPCDHTGGTNWFHPHHHGSVALQTGAGAAGMLVMQGGPHETSAMPMAIQTLPEQHLVIQEFDPAALTTYATGAQDRLFETDITAPFVLGNGCDGGAQMTVEAGQWTRLHVLNVGNTFNSYVDILPTGIIAAAKAVAGTLCDVALLGKDGVWVADAPRPVTANRLFLSISSRLDVAIRCPAVGTHTLSYQHISDAQAPEAPWTVATITVVKSLRPAAADLPAWNPCRPAYLPDVALLPKALQTAAQSFEVREGINGVPFQGAGSSVGNATLGYHALWTLQGTDLHPFHIHVNHFQYAETLTAANNFADTPDWHQPGDWIDSVSGLGLMPVYMRPERFAGTMVMHCHIAQHSDNGVIGIINIVGKGAGPLDAPTVTDWGTCPAKLPASTPFGKAPIAVPGVIEAEQFDNGGEGIAYHNVNIDRNAGSFPRTDTAVEVDTAGAVSWVGLIRSGEWMKYSVNVATTGFYSLSINAASAAPPNGLRFALWADVDGCPAVGTKTGLLALVDDPKYAGTGDYLTFAPYNAPAPVALRAGPHVLTLCFDGLDQGINLDSFTLTACGATAAACDPVVAPAAEVPGPARRWRWL